MSHENPYISRDLDIDTYVLQKDTAMSPYIVHMKTDALAKIVPKSFRTKEMQKSVDVDTRRKLIEKFDRSMEKLNNDIETMSAQCETENAKVDIQLGRIAEEENATSADRAELQEFKNRIENFTVKVERARSNSSTEDLTTPTPENGRAVKIVGEKSQRGAAKKKNQTNKKVLVIMPPSRSDKRREKK